MTGRDTRKTAALPKSRRVVSEPFSLDSVLPNDIAKVSDNNFTSKLQRIFHCIRKRSRRLAVNTAHNGDLIIEFILIQNWNVGLAVSASLVVWAVQNVMQSSV